MCGCHGPLASAILLVITGVCDAETSPPGAVCEESTTMLQTAMQKHDDTVVRTLEATEVLLAVLNPSDGDMRGYDDSWWTTDGSADPGSSWANDFKTAAWGQPLGEYIKVVAFNSGSPTSIYGTATYGVLEAYRTKSLLSLMHGGAEVMFTGGKVESVGQLLDKLPKNSGGGALDNPQNGGGDEFIDYDHALIANRQSAWNAGTNLNRLSTNLPSVGSSNGHCFSGLGGKHEHSGYSADFEASPINPYCNGKSKYDASNAISGIAACGIDNIVPVGFAFYRGGASTEAHGWQLSNVVREGLSFTKLGAGSAYDAYAFLPGTTQITFRAAQSNGHVRVGLTRDVSDDINYEHGVFIGLWPGGSMYLPPFGGNTYTTADTITMRLSEGRVSLLKNDAVLATWDDNFDDVSGLFAKMWPHESSVGVIVESEATAAPAALASAVGDPHLVNLHGKTFDLNVAGDHLLLQIPQGSGEELEVVGSVEHLPTQAFGRSPCDQFLFKKFTVRGHWVDAHKGEITINAGESLELEGFGARHEEGGKSTHTSYKHLLTQSAPAVAGSARVWACRDDNSKKQKSLCHQLRSIVGAGHRQLKVYDHKSATFVMTLPGLNSMPLHLAFSRFEGASPSYLNFALHGLGPTDDVGGLLGSDDHSEVSKQVKSCNMTHHSKPRHAAQRLSELHQKTAQVKRERQDAFHLNRVNN